MTRSNAIGTALLVALVATSGCLGLLTGDASFEASPASVGDAALEETGYELSDNRTQNLSRNVSAAGQEREVTVVNHLATYNRNVSFGPLGEQEVARFALLSTPAVEIGGRTLNPVGDWSERRIVERLSSQYSGLNDVSHQDNRTVAALGEDRTVERFTGTARIQGQRIDVTLHVTKFQHGEDFVVAVGIHPEQLPDEQDRVDTLLSGVEH